MELPDILKTILEFLIAPVFALTAYLYKNLRMDIDKMKDELQELELSVTEKYLTKSEFREFENRLFEGLTKQHTELSTKIDGINNKIYNLILNKSVDKD